MSHKILLPYIALLFVAVFVFFSRVNSLYLDYGDGVYLYASWRLAQGEIFYRDFLLAHPPVLFLFGAALMKFINSIYLIRMVLLFIYLTANLLLFMLIKRVFHNNRAALIAAFTYFIIPWSSWGSTFTPEIILSILFLLLVHIAFPLKTLNMRRIIGLVALSVIAMYTKYTAWSIIAATVGVLWFQNKKQAVWYLVFVLLIGGLVFLVLQFLSSNTFLYETFLIRKYIPAKEILTIKGELGNIAILYLPFFLSSIYIIYKYWRLQKSKIFPARGRGLDPLFVLSIPLIFSLNVFTMFREGTNGYILYPIHPFMIIGSSLIMSSIHLSWFNTSIKNFLRLFSFSILTAWLTVFLCSFFVYRISLPNNNTDNHALQTMEQYIKNNVSYSQEPLLPPFFAFIAKQRIVENYSDPFLYKWAVGNKKGNIGSKTSILQKKLEEKKVPLVMMDRVFNDNDLIKNVVKTHYTKIDTLNFGYKAEKFDIYVPR